MARADHQESLNQGNKADQDKITQKHLELRQSTRKCEELQENVDSLAQPPEEAAPVGHDTPNDPPSSTPETGNTDTTTAPITKSVSTQPAQDGNTTTGASVKTSDVKGNGRTSPPGNRKKPPKKPWKPPKLPRIPKPPFGQKNPPSGGNGPSNGPPNGGGGNGPSNGPPNGGSGRGDPDLHQRIDAKKPEMGGLMDRHHRKEAWVGGKPNFQWTGSEAPNTVDFPQPSQMR